MNYLITGGVGSLGRQLAEALLKPQYLPEYNVSRLAIFDHNENNMAALRHKLKDDRLRWFLGDIRDKPRLERAMEGVDIVLHCAALKHVDLGEYNPFEQVKTNVLGTQNCIDVALEKCVDKFITISSDKAVKACSTYGRCKALAESLTLDANNYKGDRRTKFSVIRPPNYMRSDGSVFEIWDYQKAHGLPITLTDERMTRWFMTFDEITAFITKSIRIMEGGEIFVPANARHLKIADLAKQYGPTEVVGLRRGERLDEPLMDDDEATRAQMVDLDLWVIKN